MQIATETQIKAAARKLLLQEENGTLPEWLQQPNRPNRALRRSSSSVSLTGKRFESAKIETSSARLSDSDSDSDSSSGSDSDVSDDGVSDLSRRKTTLQILGGSLEPVPGGRTLIERPLAFSLVNAGIEDWKSAGFMSTNDCERLDYQHSVDAVARLERLDRGGLLQEEDKEHAYSLKLVHEGRLTELYMLNRLSQLAQDARLNETKRKIQQFQQFSQRLAQRQGLGSAPVEEPLTPMTPMTPVAPVTPKSRNRSKTPVTSPRSINIASVSENATSLAVLRVKKTGPRATVAALVQHRLFHGFVMLSIVVSSVTLTLEHPGISRELEEQVMPKPYLHS